MEKIGRYELRGEIGRGGMATVYKGYDPRFGREVAVKVLPPALLHDPQFRARFEREAQTIATLEHPAIVPVHDFGEDDGRLYLIMRLMTGGSLADKLARGPLPVDEMARIFGRLSAALDSAHSRGIIHRDLKPANILFDQWDEPYLSDFGIVKLMEGDSATLTGTGGIVGTPAYMSPEQVLGNQSLDGRSDIYTMGVILYEALSGQRPYKSDTPMGLAFMHVNEPVPRILDASPSLPPGSQGIIDKAMAKERDRRYGTTAELAADLNQLVQPQPTFSPSRERPKPPAESPPVQKTAVTPLAETQIETPEEMKRPPTPAPDALTEQTTIEPPPAAKGRSRNMLPVVGVVALCLLFLVGAAIVGPQLGASLTEEPTPTGRPEPTERPQEQPPPRSTNIVEAPTEAAEIAEPAPGSGIPATCQDPLGCFEIGPGQPIQIAALQLLSGPSAFLGEDQLRGIELAVEEWREIGGHPIEVRPFDDGCSESQGRRAALQIAGSDTIVGIVGTSCTNAAIGAMPLLSESGFSMISGSNTSPDLTAVNGQPGPFYHPGYFRVAYNDIAQGQASARFAFQELGLRRAATFSGGEPYSQQVVNLFNDQFLQLGGEIVHTTGVNVDDPDSVRNELAVAAVSGAEIIFFPFFEAGGLNVVNEARNITGLNNTVLMGGDGLLSASFVANVGPNGVGMLFVGPAVPTGPAYEDFVARYQERYGEPPLSSFHSFAYDAANILLQAIADVVQVSDDGTLLIGRQRLRNRINNTTGYEGLTGPLNCDQFGDCGSWWIDYYRLDDPAAGLEGLLRNVVFEYRDGR